MEGKKLRMRDPELVVDEIEYDFISAERLLKADELAHYTYQIFDLQRYFSENYARSHPEGLDQDRMDRLLRAPLAARGGCRRSACRQASR